MIISSENLEKFCANEVFIFWFLTEKTDFLEIPLYTTKLTPLEHYPILASYKNESLSLEESRIIAYCSLERKLALSSVEYSTICVPLYPPAVSIAAYTSWREDIETIEVHNYFKIDF